MTERWTEFLEDEGLTTVHPHGYSHGGSEGVDAFQKLSGDTICDLTHMSLVNAGGEDTDVFLQNQLTNDVESLDAERSILAGYCNPKGRLICVFRVWRGSDGLVLELPSSLHETTIERLRKYVLRAKVEFSPDMKSVAFGVCGKTATKALEQIAGEVPQRDNGLTHSGALSIMRIPGGARPRFQVTGPEQSCIAAWQKLKQHANVVGAWTWARLDILTGIPNITSGTSETFIPQMVNLDRVGGVNFRKGCYPGQEIVARMHYLGNLKQRMARFRVDDVERPEPGDRVYTQGSTAPTGTVVDAQPGVGTGWDLLAVVRIADLDRHALYLNHENGARLFQQDLPYSLFDAGQKQEMNRE